QNNSYTGPGSFVDVVPYETCLLTGETPSVWYIFTVQIGGSFGFTINTTYDYDFAMWEVSADGCAAVQNNDPIRCNYSDDYGNTGLDYNNTQSGNLSYSASQPPIMPGIDVTVGQTFVLVVNNFTGDNSGYSITFTGSSSIFDNVPPTFTIDEPCAPGETITVYPNEPIDCSSLSAAAFTLSGNGVVTNVTGQDCGDFTTLLFVEFDLTGNPSGTYTLTPNGVKDICGNLMTGTATFEFEDIPEITPANPICEGQGTSVTLTANVSGT
ncbi:MAG TPA: Ig-like domain-containing protein, partial [Chitinophagales bacterium]|nr:Ig-like domain-containing protein [Chitinophagales bacterium]